MTNPLSKKLLIKPNSRWLLLDPPANYPASLEPLPDGVEIIYHADGNLDGIQLFIKNDEELAQGLKIIQPSLKSDTILWILYPKTNSAISNGLKIMETLDEFKPYNLRPVTSAAINETWTALRFREESLVKKSESSIAAIKQNDYAKYIDPAKKIITLPLYLQEFLEKSPQVLANYSQLSYTNKKEYVVWILDAKQEKTREDRIVKMVEKLLAGKKNPSEK